MKRYVLPVLLLALLGLTSDAGAQSGSNFVSAGQYCHVIGPPDNWLPCDSTTPLVVSIAGTVTSGASMYFVQPAASDNHAMRRPAILVVGALACAASKRRPTCN